MRMCLGVNVLGKIRVGFVLQKRGKKREINAEKQRREGGLQDNLGSFGSGIERTDATPRPAVRRVDFSGGATYIGHGTRQTYSDSNHATHASRRIRDHRAALP